jgi:hypothetical protein
MSEMISVEEYERFLKLAPTNILKEAGDGMVIALQHVSEDSPEFMVLSTMLTMLAREHQLREIEPLWRKAKRLTIRSSATIVEFTTRNSDTIKEVGAIAALIGAGALVAGLGGALIAGLAATTSQKEKK